jgi:hypothetical protein
LTGGAALPIRSRLTGLSRGENRLTDHAPGVGEPVDIPPPAGDRLTDDSPEERDRLTCSRLGRSRLTRRWCWVTAG